MSVPHPIPYQGSKRNLASVILSFFPEMLDTLVEPFAGSSAISIAAAMQRKASRFHLNDINRPLMHLWEEILEDPEGLSNAYEKLWRKQKGREREFYDEVRAEFNFHKKPDHFLYLLARCVKASIRYNLEGNFNQSPDNRRRGRHPDNMRRDIFAVSNLLRGRTKISSEDYRDILESVSTDELVYMDPPYQGVTLRRDSRYSNTVNVSEFTETLLRLVKRGIPFVLSYDGRTGSKVYGDSLPKELGLKHIEIKVGRSSQSTLLGGRDVTYESLYISEPLLEKLSLQHEYVPSKMIFRAHTQMELSLPIAN